MGSRTVGFLFPPAGTLGQQLVHEQHESSFIWNQVDYTPDFPQLSIILYPTLFPEAPSSLQEPGPGMPSEGVMTRFCVNMGWKSQLQSLLSSTLKGMKNVQTLRYFFLLQVLIFTEFYLFSPEIWFSLQHKFAFFFLYCIKQTKVFRGLADGWCRGFSNMTSL